MHAFFRAHPAAATQKGADCGLPFAFVTPEQLAQLTAWAEKLRLESDVAEARAAARAILMLADEVERLRAAAGSGDDDLRPTGGAHALAERLRSRPPRRHARLDEEPPADDSVSPAREARIATALVELSVEQLPAVDEPPALERETTSYPDSVKEARRARVQEERRRRRRGRGRLALALATLATLVFGAYAGAARIAAPDVEAHGPGDDRIGSADLDELAFWARADAGTLERLRWRVDGADATRRATRSGDRVVLDARKLGDGEHTVSIAASGPIPGADVEMSWTFAIDTRPPRVTIPTTGIPKGRPVRLVGRTEPGAKVILDGKRLELDRGRFAISYPSLPRRPLLLVASDSFGNITRRPLRIVLVPRRPPVPIRAVHVTSFAWASPPLRRGVLDLIDQGRINAVELDLKDEAGIVGFDADVPFGRRINAVRNVYDLDEAVRLLHAKGVWVIGRLVAFRDPIHAAAAWKAGRRAEVVQTPSGGAYSGYGGFTNFANPAVRRYNIDIAKAAAAAGIDDILYDYIRRPDGPRGSMVFPGLGGTPESAIVAFLTETARALRLYDVFVGVSVFGVAATRPLEVAQDIPRMAREVDYVAPMLYPSHWGPGEYDVANPNAQPYDIVRRSLADFERQTRGTGARVVPWLQDFSLGVTYGPDEVRAQIRAARDAGVPEFILWDPLVTYTGDALDRTARLAKALARRKAKSAPTMPTVAIGRKPGASRAAAVHANELGEVPVIMYHQIRSDGGGDYDLTPAEFRRELEQLYRLGYRPVRAVDLATGRLDVPAGKSPVVLAFDDSTKEQLAYLPNGEINPDTAVGIMLAFAKRYPDFELAGTFYVNREPFAGVAEGPEMLSFLVKSGFELGNHTDDHVQFDRKDAVGVQRALVRGKRIITSAVPDARVRTMALPLGVMPNPASLAVRGRWRGESYRHDGVFLVGAGPAPSPFSRAWRPAAIPRMRTGPWRGGEPDYASGFWLDVLKRNPGRRYVSDGDPSRISFPRRLARQLAPRLRGRANPY